MAQTKNTPTVTKEFKKMISQIEFNVSQDYLNYLECRSDLKEPFWGYRVEDVFLTLVGTAYEMLDCYNPKYKFLYEEALDYINKNERAQKSGVADFVNSRNFKGASPLAVIDYLSIKSSGIINRLQTTKEGKTIFIPKEFFDNAPSIGCVDKNYDYTIRKPLNFYVLYLLANKVNVVFDMTIEEMLKSDLRFDKMFLLSGKPLVVNMSDINNFYDHLRENGDIIFETFKIDDNVTNEYRVFKNDIVKSNYLKDVISLGMRTYWVLSKDNSDIDFFSVSVDNMMDYPSNEEVLSLYWTRAINFRKTISYKEIVSDGNGEYNVLAPKYVHCYDTSEIGKNENPYRITDFVTVEHIKSEKVTGDFILSSAFVQNHLNCMLKSKDVEIRSKEGYQVPSDCIIISGRPSFVEISNFNGTLYAPKNTYCIRYKENNIVSKEYLLRAFKSKFVFSQFRTYGYKRLFPIEDLWVSLPDMNTQMEIIAEESKEWARKAEAEKQKSFEDYKLDIRMKKHSLGQTLADMNNWINLLLKNKKDGILDDDDIIGKKRPISIGGVFEKIQNDMAILFQKVDSFTLGDEMERERIEVYPFVEDFIAKHESPVFKFQFNPKINERIMKNCEVYFSKDALRIILENIISNAVSHGFDKDNDNNIVKIELVEQTYDAEGYESGGEKYPYEDGMDIPVKYYLTLLVSNNGKPLANGMTQDKMVRWGETTNSSHSGIGVFQIKGLWDKFSEKEPESSEQEYDDSTNELKKLIPIPIFPIHNEKDGDFEVTSTPNDEFTVTYKFTFGEVIPRSWFDYLTGKTDLL